MIFIESMTNDSATTYDVTFGQKHTLIGMVKYVFRWRKITPFVAWRIEIMQNELWLGAAYDYDHSSFDAYISLFIGIILHLRYWRV